MALNEVADLHIYKTVDDLSPRLGQTIEWTVHLSNSGPDAARNVTVSDLIPEGVTLVDGASATAGTFDSSGGGWVIDVLEAGAVETLTLSTVVNTVDHAISIRSKVYTDSHDCDLDDNSHFVTVNPWKPTHADLQLTKTVDRESPVVGSKVAWTVTVTNEGPDTAWNTVVKDELPEGLLFVSATDDAYDPYQGEWMVGHLKSGESAQVEIVTHVDSSSGTDYVNRAVASSSTADVNLENNSAAASIDPVTAAESVPAEDSPVIPCGCLCSCEKEPEFGADLQISKFVSNPIPDYGSEVIWTIVVENNGPDDAENVLVNDSLPAGLEHVADIATLGEFDEFMGIWSIGSLASGSSAVLQITTLAANAEHAQVNIAMVSSDTADPDLSNNMDYSSIDAVGADLVVDKVVSDQAPKLGDNVTWTIEVQNKGPDLAENVIVSDALPGGVSFVSASSELFDAGSGDWTVGNLAAGESSSLSIEVIVIDADGPQVNVATVMSDTPEIDVDNNTAQAQTDAVAADLHIAKSVSDDSPDIGDVITWTIEVINHGPDAAENVVVADTLPYGVTFESASSDQFNAETGEWLVGQLAAGEAAILTIDVAVDDADGPQVNIATVISDTPEINPEDNTASAETDAVAADLELEKGVLPETAAVGEVVTWELILSNKGPDDATNILVEDVLPEGVAFLADSTDSTDFDPDTGTWTIEFLEVGGSSSLAIDATVIDTGEIINVAQVVASDQADPDSLVNNDDGDQSEDDEANATVTVPAIIDLELAQSVSSETVAVGDEVLFTISVTNTSAVNASGVTVANSGLPAHLAAGDLTINHADEAYDPLTGLWDIGAIAAGETATLKIEVTVNSTTPINNEAQVQTADQVDVDSTPGNSIATEDDQDSASLTTINSGPIAIDDFFTVVPEIEPVNAVFMVDHSGSMGTLSDGPDKGSSLGADIPLPNGGFTSRLQLVRDAVVDIAAREQVASVKVLGFDGSAGGAGNISSWYDVSGSDPDTAALSAFLDALEPSGYTNYVDALQASIDYTENSVDGIDPVPSGVTSTNYYFLTDGNPLLASGPEPATPTSDDELAWQNFVDATFDNAYAIGFGPGITQFKPLEQVAHRPFNPDDPDVMDDLNVILATEADQIPAELYDLLANSVIGNVFDNDDSGADGPLLAGSAVSSLTIGGTTYGYDGSGVFVTMGTAPDTTLITSRSVNTTTAEGGRLEFNFSNGNFEYFSPYTDIPLQETFQYTISDSTSDTDSATLTIKIEPAESVASTTTVASASVSTIEPTGVVFAESPAIEMLFADQNMVI